MRQFTSLTVLFLGFSFSMLSQHNNSKQIFTLPAVPAIENLSACLYTDTSHFFKKTNNSIFSNYLANRETSVIEKGILNKAKISTNLEFIKQCEVFHIKPDTIVDFKLIIFKPSVIIDHKIIVFKPDSAVDYK